MNREIKTIYCVGKISYKKAEEFIKLANNLSLFNSKNWRIPTWDEARKIVDKFQEAQTEEGEFFWTNNNSSTRKINLNDGSYFECNQKQKNQMSHSKAIRLSNRFYRWYHTPQKHQG